MLTPERPPAPPRVSRLVLAAIARMRRHRVMLAEMDELFARRVRREGEAAARRWYRRQVSGFVLRFAHLHPPGGARGRGRAWGDDVAHAWRSLVRAPGSSLATVLPLGLGVGAATAVFSVVNGTLLSPLPFQDAGRLVRIWESNLERGLDRFSVSRSNYHDWMSSTRTLSQAAAYLRGHETALAVDGPPREVRVSAVEPGLFPLLGVEPVLGRSLTPQDMDRPVLILGHDLWMRAFGGDPGVLGTTVLLDGVAHEVVGVMPRRFGIPNEPAVAWTPLSSVDDGGRGNRELRVLARTADGSGLADVRADLNGIAARLAEGYPDTNTGWGVAVWPLLDTVVDPTVAKGLWILLGVVGLAALVGCANVATLGLARAAAREHEMDVRAALGAGRGRLVGQLLAESAFQACGAAAVAVGSACLAVASARALGPTEVPRLDEASVDGRVLLFALAMSAAAAGVSTLLPSLRGLGVPSGGLGRARSAGERRARAWDRDALVVGQVAVSVVLLVGAALLLESFERLRARDLGFRPEGLLAMRVALPGSRYPSPAETLPAFRELLDRIGAIPGVQAVSAASQLPFLDANTGEVFVPLDAGPPATDAPPDADIRVAAPGFFGTMGIPVIAGSAEGFDDPAAGPVAILSEATARRYWQGRDPVGRRFRFGDVLTGPEFTVVGLVRDARYYGIESGPPRPMIYFPLSQYRARVLSVVVRAAPEARSAVVEALRAEVSRLDPSLAVPEVVPLSSALSGLLATRRFQAWGLGLFAACALLLAAAGLFGLTSFLARQRTREIGIRVALGARPTRVAGRLTGRGMALALLGVALGTLVALRATAILRPLLFQVSHEDWRVFVLSGTLMFAVATLANALPAWRASRCDPLVSLRSE